MNFDEVDEIIADLITEGFINEERFAINYAGGKFRLKKWGKIKIENGLRLLGLTDYCIQKGLDEIDSEDYLKTASMILLRKFGSLEGSVTIKKEKAKRFIAAKGYEYELINKLLQEY